MPQNLHSHVLVLAVGRTTHNAETRLHQICQHPMDIALLCAGLWRVSVAHRIDAVVPVVTGKRIAAAIGKTT